MGWNFYNASGEVQINDGGVQAASAVFTGNVDLGSNLLVGNAGSTGIAIDANGIITMALQPSFLGKPASENSNQTGDGTSYSIIFGTEIVDQNADFDGTSTFTAPVTGVYLFVGSICVSGLSSMESTIIRVLASNRNNICQNFNSTTL